MKTKDILKYVCIYLGKEDILSSSFFEEQGEQITSNQQAVLNKMLSCLNMVIEEISSSYLPILKQKEVNLTNCSVQISSIDPNIQEIVSVKTKSGKNVKYKIVEGNLICFANNVEVVYKVYPTTATLTSDAENFCGRISARVLAYGVASEFCFLEMLYDDSTMWETRFKNALLEIQRKKGEIKLKKRGWF